MTREELRAHPEYAKCMEKIKGYRPGFRFTMNYQQMPRAKANAMAIILRDAVKAGYLECIATSYSMEGLVTGYFSDETFERTAKMELMPMPGTTDPDWGEKHWGKGK